MKVLVSPEFSAKLSSLNVDEIRHLSAFITDAENTEKSDFLSSNRYGLTLLGNDIYNANIDSARLYFTINEDKDGDYVLLLDVSSTHSLPTRKVGGFFSSNNPKTNSSINPNINSSINPRINSSINPRINSSINPRINSSINPRINSSLNPRINSSINPKINSSINPRINSSINPKLNTSLNPRFNRSYGGPYLYNTKLSQEAFVVKANEKVDLIFGPDSELISILVSANDQIKTEFNLNNEWIGYFVKASDQVWLRYDQNNEWVGFLV
ncbi:hypothetical protein [Marinobacter pelagius]|uniref:Uncharacterized protein n=1 Tax=Marinobacter pelagius TaxID=379482 RepID=A0A1I5AF53_9GAMM|nr:hypothetical protein [Marinobacter pelagius]SFN61065.1 hypothetical protein SAMN04487961_3506 [Marinobacter pelagius]